MADQPFSVNSMFMVRGSWKTTVDMATEKVEVHDPHRHCQHTLCANSVTNGNITRTNSSDMCIGSTIYVPFVREWAV